jgi:hypothetical protein
MQGRTRTPAALTATAGCSPSARRTSTKALGPGDSSSGIRRAADGRRRDGDVRVRELRPRRVLHAGEEVVVRPIRSRPGPGRSSVDLAGPFVRNLPEGAPAEERRRGRGRGKRAPTAEPARRARAGHADRPEGSGRYPRVAARWLQRLLEEHPELTIEEAALAVSCLVALPSAGYREAAQVLKAMAETARHR